MEIEEQDFIEKISEFYHDSMRVWINAVLDLYGNVISKINNPVTQIHMDDWRILVTKQYKDLSEGEKEFYRAKARWLWYKHSNLIPFYYKGLSIHGLFIEFVDTLQ